MIRIRIFRLRTVKRVVLLILLLAGIGLITHLCTSQDKSEAAQNGQSYQVRQIAGLTSVGQAEEFDSHYTLSSAEPSFWRSVLSFLFQMDLTDPRTVVSYCIPTLTGTAAQPNVPVVAELTLEQSEAPIEFTIEEGLDRQRIQIEVDSISEPYLPSSMLPLNGDPLILIYNTHTEEAFTKTADQTYTEVEQWRTTDTQFSVVRVGAVLKAGLESYGLPVLQDTTDHEPPRHGTAYIRSLETVQKRMAEYPSLKVLIDVHRDAYIEGTQDPRAVTIGGKTMAQIQFVVGTGEGVTGAGFSQKPEWKENYKLALSITEEINRLAPGLCKPIRISTSRYNQHASDQALLVEIGHNLNTLQEVLDAVPYLSQAMANVLKVQ